RSRLRHPPARALRAVGARPHVELPLVLARVPSATDLGASEGASMLLEGKVAIVSGVGPGLGQANARALAREGATVVLAARNADYLAEVKESIEAAGGRALAVPTNLVEPEQVEALVRRTIETYRRLDIL